MGNAVAIIATLVALVAMLISYGQLRKSEFIANGSLLNEIIADLFSEGARKARETVWPLDPEGYGSWAKDERLAAEEIARSFNRVGFLLRNKYLNSKEFLEWWGPIIIRLYHITSPLIESQRVAFDYQARFVYFEWLARESVTIDGRKAWYNKNRWANTKARTDSTLLGIGLGGGVRTSNMTTVLSPITAEAQPQPGSE